MENLTVTGYDNGVGKCPFNPKSNITSLMTDNGKMFVGTATDFSGGDGAILKSEVLPNAVGVKNGEWCVWCPEIKICFFFF